MAKSRRKKGKRRFIHSRVLSIISISMVLFLIGVVTLVGFVGQSLSEYVREQVNFTILLDPEADLDEIAQMEASLEAEPFVKEVTYYSKEEALIELQKELGENPEEFLGWNPLLPTFEVQLHSEYVSEPDSLAIVEKSLLSYDLTDSLSFQNTLVDQLNKNIQIVSVTMLVAIILLLLISTVLINNTIRLLIYSRRFTIYTMKLVGATNSFIRRPFVRYNIVSGIIAVVISCLFIGWLWHHLVTSYPLLKSLLPVTYLWIVGGVVLLLGVLISWLAATASVTRYLRMDMDRLYRV